MSFKISIALLALLVLTPLIISDTPTSVKLMTLYATGLAILVAVFYSAIFNISKRPVIAKRMSLNTFLFYIAFGLAVPCLVNMVEMKVGLKGAVIALLTTGFMLNDFYLINKKNSYLQFASVLYGTAIGIVTTVILTRIYDISTENHATSVVGLVITTITIIVSYVIVKYLASKINLFNVE